MVRRVLLATALALALAAPLLPAAAAPGPWRSDIAALDGAVLGQMAKHGLPGVALAVIEGDEVVYLRGYGSAGARPMSPETQMFIGSQSKSFTALAVAQLAEHGRLDLGAPIQRYIPWFRVADSEASARITVDHLLHHTSGLSEAGYGVVLPYDASPEQAVRSLAQARLTAPVGATHQYFNLGYDTLAYLVEVVSGEPFAAYLDAHIFRPLGMAHTTAEPAAATDLAQGYTRMFGFAVPMPQVVRRYEVGAGYIVSTAADLARFAQAMLHGGAGLVTPESARRIFTPGPGGYGMGWYISADGANISHGGANETFRTEVNLYPARGRAFVLLVNEGHLVDHFISAAQLAASVEAAVLGEPVPPVEAGWSVRWMGYGFGLFVLALCLLHLWNFRALFRGWPERAGAMGPARRAMDVAISFVIPSVILAVVFSQMQGFFGNRFHLLTTLASFGLAMPDVFILMLVGTLPDYAQGLLKLAWLLSGRAQGLPVRAPSRPDPSCARAVAARDTRH